MSSLFMCGFSLTKTHQRTILLLSKSSAVFGMAPQNKALKPSTKTSPPRKKSAGRPKTPISKETIIHLAAQHFTDRGYSGTSLDDIARSAGLTKPALLYHYPSKEQLYLAVMDFYVAVLSKLILDALVGEGDFEQRLDALSELMVDYLGQHPALARLLLREAMDNGPFITRQGQTLVQYALELTYRFLRAGIPAETLDDEAIRHLVISILGIHFMYFNLPQITSPFTGMSPFAAAAIEARKHIVKQQVRLLCFRSPRTDA